MAYLDDNNDNLYTQGDPLDDLDQELAQLQASLDELNELIDPAAQETTEKPVKE